MRHQAPFAVSRSARWYSRYCCGGDALKRDGPGVPPVKFKMVDREKDAALFVGGLTVKTQQGGV